MKLSELNENTTKVTHDELKRALSSKKPKMSDEVFKNQQRIAKKRDAENARKKAIADKKPKDAPADTEKFWSGYGKKRGPTDPDLNRND